MVVAELGRHPVTDDAARQWFPLARQMARVAARHHPRVAYDDFYSAALVGIAQALRTFNPKRAALNTHVTWHIRGMLRACSRACSALRCVDLDSDEGVDVAESMPDNEPSAEELHDRQVTINEFWRLLTPAVDLRDYTILRLRLLECIPRTEVAAVLKMDPETLRRHELRLVETLRVVMAPLRGS